MKNNILKFYIVAIYLCSTFVMFAQPNDTDGTGGLESGDAPQASIDNLLPLLLILAVVFCFYAIQSD